ncbi:MAG: HAD-IIB family hydrolase [Oligoflexus sp.]
MKRYLILLDFDGTLVDRDGNGCREKIKFAELADVKSIYKQFFDIEIDYKVLSSSCAQSIEDIMSISEMASIGEWLFEHGLHVKNYPDCIDRVQNDKNIEIFLKLKPQLFSWLGELHDRYVGDVLQSTSEKNVSMAIHLKHSQNEIYHALLADFGKQCTIIKSGNQTIEIFPKNYDKSWALNQLNLHAYDRVVFIGDSIYPGGNDHAVANSPKVDFSIEVKSPRDTSALLANMQSTRGQIPFHSSILNGTQARVVIDRKNALINDIQIFNEKKYILLDFDGTLTYEQGQVFPKILEILKALSATYKIWIITGRSLGWADMMINTFPIDGVIGENGAFAFYWDERHKKIKMWKSKHLAANYKQRLEDLKHKISIEFPHITFASDQFSREHDIAAVVNEHGEVLSSEQMENLMFWVRSEGACAAISNIHLNIWFGDYNKAQTVIELFNELYHVCNFELCRRSFYIGDSPNDEPMFRLIDASFGVKNVELFLDRLCYKPAAISSDAEAFGAYDILRSILEKKDSIMNHYSSTIRPNIRKFYAL